MVSQAVEEVVSVSDPEPEVQTETPEVEFTQPVEEVPAEPQGEPAAEDDRLAKLEAEIASLRQRDEERAKQAERERRQRQREGSIRAQAEQRQQADEAEATELLQAQLVRQGLIETDVNAVKPILDRYTQKRESFVVQRNLDDVANAFSAAAAEVLDTDFDGELSPRAQAYSQNFLPFVKDMYERAKTEAAQSNDLVSRADMNKMVDAEIERRNAAARKGRPPLKSPDGTPSNIDRSHQATIDRVAKNLGDQQDQDYAAAYVARLRNR